MITAWRPRLPDPAGRTRFEDVLDRDRRDLEAGLGRAFELRTRQVGGTLVGWIGADAGVRGWQGWWDGGASGVAWGGVCEAWLGSTLDGALVGRVSDRLRAGGSEVVDWPGRWAACAWSDEDPDPVLVTGATESPTMWSTDGPAGWAVGHRALALLELVGRPPEVDVDAATELVAFGWLIGTRGLWNGVERVPARTRVVLGFDGARASRWVGLDAYLAPAIDGSHRPDVRRSADRLRFRVERQLRHGPDALVLLTGGRDSRAIAAAAVAAGFEGEAVTGGAEGSADVRVASQVAAAMGLRHRRSVAPPVGYPGSLGVDALSRWERCMDQGVMSLRQALSHHRFFLGRLPVAEPLAPLFHGLGGEIARGYHYPASGLEAPARPQALVAALRRKLPPGLALRRDPARAIERAVAGLHGELGPLRPTLSQWLDVHYWQDRCLQWGEDLMAGGDLVGWHWAPFMDRAWVLDAWALPTRPKAASGWVQAVTAELRPEVERVPYAAAAGGPRRLARRLGAASMRAVGRVHPASGRRLLGLAGGGRVAPSTAELWRRVLLGPGPHLWPDLIERRDLDATLAAPGLADVAWQLVTVELAAQASAR